MEKKVWILILKVWISTWESVKLDFKSGTTAFGKCDFLFQKCDFELLWTPKYVFQFKNAFFQLQKCNFWLKTMIFHFKSTIKTMKFDSWSVNFNLKVSIFEFEKCDFQFQNYIFLFEQSLIVKTFSLKQASLISCENFVGTLFGTSSLYGIIYMTSQIKKDANVAISL